MTGETRAEISEENPWEGLTKLAYTTGLYMRNLSVPVHGSCGESARNSAQAAPPREQRDLTKTRTVQETALGVGMGVGAKTSQSLPEHEGEQRRRKQPQCCKLLDGGGSLVVRAREGELAGKVW